MQRINKKNLYLSILNNILAFIFSISFSFSCGDLDLLDLESEAQEILENWLGNPVSILAPPGNDYSFKTVRACEDTNIKYIHSSRNFVPEDSSIIFLDSSKCVCFHDREVKLYGKKYIQKLLNN